MLIVTGGRLDHQADTATAVWAFDILRYTAPELTLFVLGHGPESERLKRFTRATRAGDAIQFHGLLADQFAAAAQVWIPHRQGGERLALAALASGRPVVAAETSTLRATLGDAARYFRPGDRAGLAVQARRLLDRPAEAAALGDAARARAAHFPAWQLADPLAAVYHEAGGS